MVWKHKKENAQLSIDIHGMIEKTNEKIGEIQAVLDEDEDGESEDDSASRSNNNGTPNTNNNKINIQIGSKNGSPNQSRINNDSKTSDLKDLSIESLKKDSLAESQRSPRDDESPEARALRKEMS